MGESIDSVSPLTELALSVYRSKLTEEITGSILEDVIELHQDTANGKGEHNLAKRDGSCAA